MINYTDKKNIIKMIDLESLSLSSNLDIQKNLNKQLLTFMKNFIGHINLDLEFTLNSKNFKYINTSSDFLKRSNSNIKSLQLLLNNLNNFKALINKSTNIEEIEPLIEKYNNRFSTSIKKIYNNTTLIQKFLFDISAKNIQPVMSTENNELLNFAKSQNTVKENNVDNLIITKDELELSYLEHTLVISDIQGKVILPYEIEELKNILYDNNKYTSLDEIINELYTVPIEKYKFSALARFKEAYKLIIEKEHGSKTHALSLASELFFNYNLHPAIITACKNLDELDIYLACLEDGNLDKFNFFDIKYEILPTVSASDKI